MDFSHVPDSKEEVSKNQKPAEAMPVSDARQPVVAESETQPAAARDDADESTGDVVAAEEKAVPDMAKIEAFRDWLQRWQPATPEERENLREEGIRLAAERRAELKALIAINPKLALEYAVSRVARQDLPAALVAHLEKPVSSVGTYNVYKGRPQPGVEVPVERLTLRYFEADGVSYKARVFDDLEEVMSHGKLPLQGYAVDREFAVVPNAVRKLDVGEKIPAGTLVQEICPVSKETTVAVSSGEEVTADTPTVDIGGTLITLCNDAHVEVLQDEFRTFIQGAGSGGSGYFIDNFPGTSAKAIGGFKCLYIRAIYANQTEVPNTEAQASRDMQDNARFYIENSFGKMTQTTTYTPLVTLPHTTKWYIDKDGEIDGLGQVHTDARAAAKAAGFDSASFDCIIVRIEDGPRLNGFSWGGGSSVWITWDGMDVLNHECGHSLGLNHANFWQTTDGTPYGTGANEEYGNDIDVMGGGGGFKAHYNTISKEKLGWLAPNYIHAATTSGTYRIFAFDQPTLEEGRRYALNVPKDGVRKYHLEFHQATPGTYQNGAVILYSGIGSNAGHLIDSTPGTPAGKKDATIQVGRTYSDLESDQHFTVVSKNATMPPSLDINYQHGPFPGNTAPTTTLAADQTTIAPGGSVMFTATANDANGDALAYYWEFSDGLSATNTNVFTRTFDVAGQYTALLTVSDMKGGTVRRSIVINVGTHTKQAITGTVTVSGSPLAGVFISNGTLGAYSNTDGSYTLAGLNTGSAALTATLAGYTITTPTNPHTVVAGTNTVNWTATAGTAITLTKTADATEGGGNGNFRITRTGSTAADLTVLVAPLAGSALITTDFTTSPTLVAQGTFFTVTIPTGSTFRDITITAVNDALAEGPETITMQIVSAAGYVSLVANSVTMTLNDNDTSLPQVGVVASDPTGMEPADHAAFIFTRSGSTAASLAVVVTWGGTATNGSDYNSLSASVTIPVGQASVTVPVNVINDSAIEMPETVIATLATGATYIANPIASTATVTISDNDAPSVSIAGSDPDASEEGDTGVLLVTRTGNTAAALKVYYGMTGSASYGTDYAALNGEVTIPAGATSAGIVISPYDDDIAESNESVVVTLTSFDNAYGISQANQATVTIADNADLPLISVREGEIGVEGGAAASLIFNSVGATGGNVIVNYTVSGTATSGSDFTALSGSIVLPVNGSTDTVLSIPVSDDAIAEGVETVAVKITPSAAYRAFNDSSATALIRDNDGGGALERVMVSTYSTLPTAEGGAASKFYFSRSLGTTGNLSVNYTISGTANNGGDVSALSGTCIIPDGQNGVEVPFTIVDDSTAEGTETLTVTVQPSAAYGADFPASATYEITDNDAAVTTVGFVEAVMKTSEKPGPLGEFRDIPVVLSSTSSETITVRCISAGGSALGDDVDWALVDPSNGNAVVPSILLNFPPGITSVPVRIRVKDDGFVEGAETIVLQLTSPTKSSFTKGRATNTLLIYDEIQPDVVTEERWNDPLVFANDTWNDFNADLTIYLPDFTPPQNVGSNYSRRLTGIITAPATGTYNFWVAADDKARLFVSTDELPAHKVQVATLNSDVSFQAWDVNPSQQSGNITLTVGQKYYVEVQHLENGGGDHVSIAWQGPGFVRTPVTFTPPVVAPRFVRMANESTTRKEGDATEPQLLAVLDRPAGATPITVSYFTGGTATAGSDFTLAPGVITFNAGEQIKPIPLAILNDATGEGPETVVVSLTNPNGVFIADPSSHTITLLDTLAPTVEEIFTSASSSQGVGALITTAVAVPGPGRTIASWTIIAGNTGNAFAINASGQLTLATPGALPNPGGMELIVRATDNTGSAADGVIHIVCNPPPGGPVYEERHAGALAYDSQSWTTTPIFTGTLPTLTTPQSVGSDYSRRLLTYLKPTTTGSYTFWIASDDGSRLFLSTDGYEANKVQIASASGYTGFQEWDKQPAQKSVAIPLLAGKAYWLEVHHRENSGGDHVSVAWAGPSISRVAIPGAVLSPSLPGLNFAPPKPKAIGQPPVFTVSPMTRPTATESANYTGSTIAGTATDPDAGDVITYSRVAGPGWLQVASNGALSGIPTNADVGLNTFTVRVTDRLGHWSDATLQITVGNVNSAPLFTSNPINLGNTNQGSLFTASITSLAMDPDAGDTITFSKVSGPAWLTVAANGTLSGTPSASDTGANSFVVRVTDSGSLTGDATVNINVVPINNSSVWISLVEGTWSTLGNWSANTPADGAGNTADFSTLNLTTDVTVGVNSVRTIGNLIFNDTGADPDSAWTVSGSTLTLAGGAGSSILTNNNVTFTNTLTGSNVITKTGPGVLTLAGENSFTGGMVIQQGKVQAATGASLGTGTILGNSSYGASRVSGGTPFLAVGGSGLQVVANPIVIPNPASTAYYAIQSTGGNLELFGTISGGGPNSVLQIDSASSGDNSTMTTLSGNNTLTGQILLNRGRLTIANAQAAGTAKIRIRTNANDAGNLVFSNSFTFVNDVEITLGGDTVSPLEHDVILTGEFKSSVDWRKSGTGRLVLNGPVTGNGKPLVLAGTLELNTTVAGDVTIDSADSPGTATLAGTGTLNGAVDVVADGKLAPGSSGIGSLRINNTLHLAGTTAMEIRKLGGMRINDTVIGLSGVTYGGALVVTKLGTDALIAGDTFQLFEAGTYTGNFSSVSLPPLPSNMSWDTTGLSSAGTIKVISVGAPFNSWTQANFGSLAGEPTIAGPGTDPDEDGMENLLEYALNSNPNQPSAADQPKGAVESGNLTMTYRRNVGATDLTYIVEISTSLGDGTWSSAGISEQILSNDGLTQVMKATLPIGAEPRKFMRLRVVLND
ncbi:MAG: Calx-beta domain-containing protein [Verrucomicrobiota bacterium]